MFKYFKNISQKNKGNFLGEKKSPCGSRGGILSLYYGIDWASGNTNELIMARRNASELIMDITAVNHELILDTFKYIFENIVLQY